MINTILYSSTRDAVFHGKMTESNVRCQFIDEQRGYKCLIKHHTSMGHYCGYVTIPVTHPNYRSDKDSEVFDLNTHHGGPEQCSDLIAATGHLSGLW